MGLVDILDDEMKIPKDNEDYKSDTNKVNLKKNNDLVYADLMMSVDQDTCFNIL